MADGTNLELALNHDPLRDAPDGRIIPVSADLKFNRVRFIRTDGDWAYVNGRELTNGTLTQPNFGWIRWRRGRKILVGAFLITMSYLIQKLHHQPWFRDGSLLPSIVRILSQLLGIDASNVSR